MGKDMLSQDEIDMLLKGTDNVESESITTRGITDIEKDTLGEIGNISMGTAATTLSTLLNRKVTITTPIVKMTNTDELSYEYPIPFIAVDVKYKVGFEGSNILMIKTDDVKIITDIMVGKEEIGIDRELTEMDLSAISEVMNQMMGSSSTSLSEIFQKRIEIDPPMALEITFQEGREKLDVLKTSDPIIRVSFKMVVEDLINSELMLLIPTEFGQEMVENLMSFEEDPPLEIKSIDKDIEFNKVKDNLSANSIQHPLMDSTKDSKKDEENVIIKRPNFETFEIDEAISHNESISIVEDIPVELAVELGRTIKRIGEILEYGPGTVIELDKLVGEPLDIYANGKFIARGEVVVIDDNFGIRITDVSSRLNG